MVFDALETEEADSVVEAATLTAGNILFREVIE
jgi:hypothetical protein